MYKFWFAIENREWANRLKQAIKKGSEIEATLFPATGEPQRPFPTLLEVIGRGQPDALYYDSPHQPLPSQTLLRKIPTVIALESVRLRPFVRERNYTTRSNLTWLLNNKDERVGPLLRQAAGLVVWSEWGRQELVNKFGIEPEKVLVAPLEADLAEWDNTQAAFQIARRPQTELPERIRLLFAGDEFESLGGALLLDIFRNDPQLAELCELHLIARRAAVTNHLEGLPANLKVTLHSPDEPAELYLNSDLYLAPALEAVSPALLATALAASLPVIASRIGGLPELVQDGYSGLLVKPGDPTSLKAAIKMLANDPARRYELGQGARELAETRFELTQTVPPLVNFIRQRHKNFKRAGGQKLMSGPGYSTGRVSMQTAAATQV